MEPKFKSMLTMFLHIIQCYL